ncbi:hypothetical protein HNR65_003568 [Desulfosalsimonas propionicica]|uniref:Uncharacterized protein n=1 Tax=Desulfosalsimonas propionicica TaxID=332175 RepID=A0A7W0HML9_9BACT|nr:hypothetical protein [Desulfosalsimonas propionicica]
MDDILNRQKIRGSIMLTHPIIEKLQVMKFYGMRKAFEEQLQMAATPNCYPHWPKQTFWFSMTGAVKIKQGAAERFS